MRKFLPVAIVVIAVFGYDWFSRGIETTEEVRSSVDSPVVSNSEWQSGQQVQGSGVVVRILSDDNEGSRHQRFIIELSAGRTLLVAHNIDIANRVSSLQNGDRVTFNGEYEWNNRGGVIHWTHRDPQGRHVDGWIEHNGRKYQ